MAVSTANLIVQLNEYKLASEKELGVVRGKVFAEVAGRFPETDEKVTKLVEEVAKQSKATEETFGTLQTLTISIENLGDNLIKIRDNTKSWKETKVMDAEEELINLIGPISLLEAVTSAPKVINPMFTNSDFHPPGSTPDVFLISGLGGIPPSSQAQDNPRPSSISRPGISMGFGSNTTSIVHCVRVSLTGTIVATSRAHWSLVRDWFCTFNTHSVALFVGMGPL